MLLCRFWGNLLLIMPLIRPALSTPVAAFATEEATTTLRISTGLRDQAKTYAGTLDVSLKDFTENALWYFIRYKLNPVTANRVEDVPKEVHRLRNQVVGVLKTQEAQYSSPSCRKYTPCMSGCSGSRSSGRAERVFCPTPPTAVQDQNHSGHQPDDFVLPLRPGGRIGERSSSTKQAAV